MRAERGETLEQFGAAIGVNSKGKMSEIERGLRTATPEQALAIERISGGRVDAAALNALIAEARGSVGDVHATHSSNREVRDHGA